MGIEIRVKKVYKLSSDYQEMFINNASQTIVKYEELALSQRNIHKDYYDDIYILEPSQYYKIDFDYEFVKQMLTDEYITMNGTDSVHKMKLHYDIEDKLISCGLIISKVSDYVYLYNAGDNMVFLHDDAVIGSVSYG